jgi:hypothetical protein
MIALELMRHRFALHPCVLRAACCVRGPVVWARPRHSPWQQALDPLLQGGFVRSTTLPVQLRPGVTLQGVPAPGCAPFWLELGPPLSPLHEDRSAGRLRFLRVLQSNGAEPVEHGLGRDSQEEREAMPGEATQIQAHGVNLPRAWLLTWGGAGKLIAPWPTALLGLAGSGAVVDEPITLALGTSLPR